MFGWIITGGLLLRERAQEYVRIETISAIKHLRSWKNISRSDVTADKNIRNAALLSLGKIGQETTVCDSR